MSDEAETPELTLLRASLDDVLVLKDCKFGYGPMMAFFDTPPDAEGNWTRYQYVSFGMLGPQSERTGMPTASSFDELHKAVRKAFYDWVQPKRTLVWRMTPQLECVDGLWRCFFRCVQLEDDAMEFPVMWHL